MGNQGRRREFGPNEFAVHCYSIDFCGWLAVRIFSCICGDIVGICRGLGADEDERSCDEGQDAMDVQSGAICCIIGRAVAAACAIESTGAVLLWFTSAKCRTRWL